MASYRCYVFVHSFLGTIHKGVQAAHAVAELVDTYCVSDVQGMKNCVAVGQWVKKDKTLLLLEGGNSNSLHELEALAKESKLPHSVFCEDGDTLEGITTAVAVVVCDTSLEKYKSKLRTKDTIQKRIVSARLAT